MKSMSLNKLLNFLNENKKVKIRRSDEEITIFLDKDIVKINTEDKRVEFPDMDSVNEQALEKKYYRNFPELKPLFRKLVEEEYDIQP
jgi:hypothetical protein